jgi:hypothetical protein
VSGVSAHPPWLRFQAYVVGLPKTGSTSLASVFARYRAGHEWQMRELIPLALARQRGELTDGQFLAATSGRIRPASLEMDSATFHHLYADLLRDTFPHAMFVHSVRDVVSWSTSLLDMVLAKRMARRFLEIGLDSWELEYLQTATGEGCPVDPGSDDDDRAALVPLMRYWSHHLRQMAEQLPPERTLQLRTRDIGRRTDDLAAFVGVPPRTLRADLAHSNRAPLTLDRFAAFDGVDLRDAYDAYCADLMADLFPQEHAAFTARRRRPVADAETDAWSRHLTAVQARARSAVERHGAQVAH